MINKLTWFYRISIWLSAMLIFALILIKTILWSSAEKEANFEHPYPIFVCPSIFSFRPKYMNESQQKLFNQAEHLLTPAFVILFIVLTVKLVKAPDIFKEEK